MKLITIDCGTSFIKTALMSLDTGKVLKQSSKQTKNITETLNIINEVLAEFKEFDTEFSVAISTEMHGYILVDYNGHALCDYVSWKDEWALQEYGDGTYLDRIESVAGLDVFKVSGMALKPGIASTNLFVMLDKDSSLMEQNAIFLTLGDYIIYYLTGIIPVMHPTNAAASGLYDLSGKKWNEPLIKALGYDFLKFPDVSEGQIVDVDIHSCKYHFYESLGDQQAALLGAGLAECDAVSYNLGTGSQVSVLNKKLTFNTSIYQTRPFFYGRYLNTIPHVPCGRALNVYINFCRELIHSYTGHDVDDKRLWDTLTECAGESEKSDLELDMSFFANSVSDRTRGSIGNISEYNFMPGKLMRAAYEKMADNYYMVTEKLVDDNSKIHKLIFSGGIAARNPFLRECIAAGYENCDVIVASNETFYGLWKYVKGVNDGTIR